MMAMGEVFTFFALKESYPQKVHCFSKSTLNFGNLILTLILFRVPSKQTCIAASIFKTNKVKLMYINLVRFIHMISKIQTVRHVYDNLLTVPIQPTV